MSNFTFNVTRTSQTKTIPIVERSLRARQRRQILIAYAFLAPSLVIFLFFRHIPAIASLLLGFFDWSVLAPPQFVGLTNYISLWQDAVFWRALANTVEYTVIVVPTDIVIALGLA